VITVDANVLLGVFAARTQSFRALANKLIIAGVVTIPAVFAVSYDCGRQPVDSEDQGRITCFSIDQNPQRDALRYQNEFSDTMDD